MRRVILSNMAAARNHLLVRQAVFDNEETITLFQFDPQGHHLAIVGRSGLVRYWDADTGEPQFSQQLPPARIMASDIDEQTTRIFSSNGRLLSMYSLSPTQAPVKAWEIEQPDEIQQIVVKPDHSQAAVCQRSNARWSVRVFQMADGRSIADIPVGQPTQIVFDEANEQLICVTERNVAQFWKWHTASNEYQLTGTLENVQCLTVSPDGKWIMTGTTQGNVHCYNSKTLAIRTTIGPHQGSVVALAVSPDSEK